MSHIHTLAYMQMKHLIIGKYINKIFVNVSKYFDITAKCNTAKYNYCQYNVVTSVYNTLLLLISILFL